MMNSSSIEILLSGKLTLPGIRRIVAWAATDEACREALLKFTLSDNLKVSTNALWCLSHLPKSDAGWLQGLQNDFIDRLLVETHVPKKRIFLQLLREQNYTKDSIRTDFLDFCFSKINSECEPYAVRCFCIYCAFKMSKFYPELIAELDGYLQMLSTQNLSSGLRCALRTTEKNIANLVV